MKKYIEPKTKVAKGEFSRAIAQIYQGSVEEQLGKERRDAENESSQTRDSKTWSDGLW